MSEMKFEVQITAVGEVRDKDGNLLSSEPWESTREMTADELDALGIARPPYPDEEK